MALRQTFVTAAIAVSAAVVPGAQGTFFLSFPPPPPTLAALVAQSPVIVHGSVQEVLPLRYRAPLIYQHVLVRVEEVLKMSDVVALPRDVIVERPGGAMEVEGKRMRTASSGVPLDPFSDVILFLRQDDNNRFRLQSEYGGIYRFGMSGRPVTGIPGSVLVNDFRRSAKRFDGRSARTDPRAIAIGRFGLQPSALSLQPFIP